MCCNPTHPAELDEVLEIDGSCKPHIQAEGIASGHHLQQRAQKHHEQQKGRLGGLCGAAQVTPCHQPHLEHSNGISQLLGGSLELLLRLFDHILRERGAPEVRAVSLSGAIRSGSRHQMHTYPVIADCPGEHLRELSFHLPGCSLIVMFDRVP